MEALCRPAQQLQLWLCEFHVNDEEEPTQPEPEFMEHVYQDLSAATIEDLGSPAPSPLPRPWAVRKTARGPGAPRACLWALAARSQLKNEDDHMRE